MNRTSSSIVVAVVAGVLGACGGSSNPVPEMSADAGTPTQQCSGGSNACDTCGYASCCSEAQTCADSTQCDDFYSCAAACNGAQACLNSCASEYPAGVTAANALAECLSTNCKQQCSAPVDVSPIGVWNLDLDFAADNCGHGVSYATETLSIAQGTNGYAVTSGTATISGTMTCSPTSCVASPVLTYVSNSTVYQQTLQLTLLSNNTITGTGTETWDTCSSAMTITGTNE
jgi:hypothetical protein